MMFSFRIPLMLSMLISGVCWMESYTFYIIPKYEESIIFLVIASISLIIGGALLGKNEADTYNLGYRAGVDTSEKFVELLKQQREREE